MVHGSWFPPYDGGSATLVNLVNMVICLLIAPGRKASEHTLGVNSESKKTLPL